jgi:hypothetical protein
MRFFNVVITMFVGGIMLVGAGMTLHYRMIEQRAETEGNPLAGVAIVSPRFVAEVG